MNSELILKSDVLDIVFENRNKEYGAYNLRKFYSNRLVKSLALMLGGVVLLSAFTFLPNKKAAVKDDEMITRTVSLEQPKEKKEPQKKKETPQEQPAKAKQQPTQEFTEPVIVDKKLQANVLQTLIDSVAIGAITDLKNPGDIGIVLPVTLSGTGDKPVIRIPDVDINKPMDLGEVDVYPAFPNDGLIKFLKRNLTNPRDLEEDETVSVQVRFVIGYDGKLKGFTVVKDGGEEFNKEVIRVLKKMPDWIPGKRKGQNVSVYYTIPVKFIAE